MYRTEGSHVTIWCNVSGFQGPSEQNFQWSIYLPSAPEREVQIVSTVDSSFPYAIYTQRVRSGKIYVERVQGNSALLHITDLQARDAGEYECYTPNTDEQYFGSYSAKMSLVGKETAIAVRWCPARASPSVRLSWPERLRQQALTSHGLDAGRRPGQLWWDPSSWLRAAHFSPCPHVVDREGGSSLRPLCKGTCPCMGGCTLLTCSLPTGLLSKYSSPGDWVSTCDYAGDINIQSITLSYFFWRTTLINLKKKPKTSPRILEISQ